MKKKKLFLDIDDTVLDTENYLRKVLGGKWSTYKGLIYEAYDHMSAEEICKVMKVLGDYSKIPFITGAKEGLKLLSMEYDVVFCSVYFTEMERKAKLLWANSNGFPITLCKEHGKCEVDMCDSVFVDDNTDNLNDSNASSKVCFYKKGNFFEYDGVVVFDWFDLVDKLCGRK